MQNISQFFQANLDVVFFLYGLSFVAMGLLILAQPKRESEFSLSGILWLFVAYALIHAPADFIDMWVASRGFSLHIPQAVITSVSYLFLFEFGRKLLLLSGIRLPALLLPVIAISIVMGSLLSSHPWTMFHVLTGYMLRLPAGIIAGAGLLRYYRTQRELLEPMKTKPFFFVAGASFLAWAFFCGIFRAEGDFFPAAHINTSSFLAIVGIPVHVFRMICALFVAGSLAGILRIFDWEMKGKQQKLVLELKDALANVKTLQGFLPICSFCKKIRDDKGNWNQIEHYVAQRSEAQFSHGLCPACGQKHYPEFFKKD